MYAAFSKYERELFQHLSKGKKHFLDPMSGYWSLREECNEIGLNYFFVEYNAPQYLWQVLNARKKVKQFDLEVVKNKWLEVLS